MQYLVSVKLFYTLYRNIPPGLPLETWTGDSYSIHPHSTSTSD